MYGQYNEKCGHGHQWCWTKQNQSKFLEFNYYNQSWQNICVTQILHSH